MNDIRLLHTPQWQLSGTDWLFVVGNQTVAKLVPNFDKDRPRCKWLSIIDFPDYPDHGWHAVDFATLESAKADIEQWWQQMCRGEAFRP